MLHDAYTNYEANDDVNIYFFQSMKTYGKQHSMIDENKEYWRYVSFRGFVLS